MKSRVRLAVVFGMIVGGWTATTAAPAPDPERFHDIAVLHCQFRVGNLVFSPNGKLLATADASRTGVRLWDVATGKVALILPHREAGHVQFSPDGKMVATVSRDIKLWETSSGKQLAHFPQVSARWLLFCADGKMLAAVAKDYVTVLSIEEKKELRCYDVAKTRHAVRGYPANKSPVFILDHGKEKPFSLIDPFTGKEVGTCEKSLVNGHLFAVDGKDSILAGYCWEFESPRRSGCEIVLWDPSKGKRINSWVPPIRGMQQTLALSPDGSLLVFFDSVGGLVDPALPKSGLRFYEVPTGRLLGIHEMIGLNCINRDYDGIHGLAFSPDGRLLATAEGHTVRLWTIPKAWRKKPAAGKQEKKSEPRR